MIWYDSCMELNPYKQGKPGHRKRPSQESHRMISNF